MKNTTTFVDRVSTTNNPIESAHRHGRLVPLLPEVLTARDETEARIAHQLRDAIFIGESIVMLSDLDGKAKKVVADAVINWKRALRQNGHPLPEGAIE